MRGTSSLICLMLFACGGSRTVSSDGGTSSGSGSASSGDTQEGSEGAESEAATDEGEVDSISEGESDGESESAETSTSTDGGEEEDTGSSEPCVIALALDTCCSQPVAASAATLESESCLVPWPVDWDAIPADLLADCVSQQPEFCEVVDCDYVAPPTEEVQLDATGECAWLCPEGESIAYFDAGCENPPPIASCSPPPPPCVMDFCSCEGETISGCGQTHVPHAHAGPCE